MADRKASKPKKPKTARWQRMVMMDKEILDVQARCYADRRLDDPISLLLAYELQLSTGRCTRQA